MHILRTHTTCTQPDQPVSIQYHVLVEITRVLIDERFLNSFVTARVRGYKWCIVPLCEPTPNSSRTRATGAPTRSIQLHYARPVHILQQEILLSLST